MSNTGDANGVEFSLLYDVDDFYLSEELEDYYDQLPKDVMVPWRIKSYFRTPLHLWRCPKCRRLYIFNAQEEHKLSSLYYPAELLSENRKLYEAFRTLYPQKALPEFILLLAKRGFSKMECIKAINEATGCGLGEAKNLVHLNPAFEYCRVSDEAFHGEVINALDQISGESMTTNSLRRRAVGILFNDQNEVLLMLRRKNGKAYATLPGGGIEEGESPAEACAREVLEEVNLVVEVGPEVLVLDNLNNHEHYFLTRFVSGEMRLGDGPEGTIRQSEQNWYQPEWVGLDRLEEVNLVPEQARGLVRNLASSMP